jgi:MFS family permease
MEAMSVRGISSALMSRRLPRTVVALGLVSLLTDVSSEMIYPLLPAFLATLGAGGAFVGLVEGVAETTSSFLKLLSGLISDRLRRKKPLVLAGYALASAARPLLAIACAPWHVLAIRFTDRVGKGIRTSPRDALIAQATPDDRRGAAFGFHRAMDHAGALFGPLFAFALVSFFGLGARAIFALAALPAAGAVIALIAGVREDPGADHPPATSPGGVRDVPGAGRLPGSLRAYLAIVALFTLANASDAFILLRAQDAGIPAGRAPLLWALLHATKSIFSAPMGALSDRVGRRALIAGGWLVYALTYLGFAWARAPWHIYALFAVYGAYFALAEGAEKALVADLAPRDARGRAFGAFHFVTGTCALPASLGFGLLWDRISHGAAFVAAAALAALATAALVSAPLAPARSRTAS